MNTGIICEFNPFHNGHKYIIESIKNSGGVICVMSGNFVQRGEFAVYDKFERAKAAVENGADLVIELPTRYSTLSAQGFAKAGVSLLEATGICSSIAFGAECDDINELLKTAKEIEEKDAEIKKELEKGISYPKARQNIINSPILDSPNNILALEYLRFTSLNPVPIKRIGGGHDSGDELYSSSAIRKKLSKNSVSSIKNCEKAVLYKLRTMSADEFRQIEDVSEGLENRIIEAVKHAKNLDELYDLIKTKRYTHSRIRRIILRAFLGIKSNGATEPTYLRVLAFNSNGKDLLKEIKKASSLPIITSYKDAKTNGGKVLDDFLEECSYTDLFNLGYTEPKSTGTEQASAVVCV